MSAKTILGAFLVGAWLNCAVAGAQEAQFQLPGRGPASSYPTADTPPGAVLPSTGPAQASPAADPGNPAGYACGGVCPTNTGLSDWILFRRDNGCQCPPGNGRQMMIEVYARSGLSVPVGGGLLNE